MSAFKFIQAMASIHILLSLIFGLASCEKFISKFEDTEIRGRILHENNTHLMLNFDRKFALFLFHSLSPSLVHLSIQEFKLPFHIIIIIIVKLYFFAIR